jgi:enamine deaminase RidA (YjgF/YER057c/UK114 family)
LTPGEIERRAGDPPVPWEEPYGYSRVVRAGAFVLVAGTTAADPNGAVLGETPYEQTVEILRKIEHELARAGASLSDVVRTRIFVTDISRADEVGRAHGEAFGAARPVTAMLEVSSLLDPRTLVEIEADAFVG